MINLAVIPARAGSTRLKNKNISILNGKPLICYTIEAVIDSELFDTILIATDSQAIIDISKEYKQVYAYRRNKFIDEKSTVLEAMLEIFYEFEYDNFDSDIFSYFLPTCPFRTSTDIKDGAALFTHKVDSVVSIVEYSDPIQLAVYKLTEPDQINPHFPHLISGDTNSKFMDKYYHPNGGFYMSKWNSLRFYNNFFKGTTRGYVMPKNRSFDINDAFDLEVANIYAKRHY